MEKFLKPHKGRITREDREKLKGHKSFVLWFTGLSGAGKSTLSHAVEERLHKMGIHTYVLDGDNVRMGLNKDLGFSQKDRKENIRRVGEVAKLFVDAGVVVITAFISPYREDREFVRNLLNKGDFIEVYVKCPLEICERRDPKGLYKKVRQGLIKEFTGIDSPYEEPINPEIVVETHKMGVDECVERIVNYLKERKLIPSKEEL